MRLEKTHPLAIRWFHWINFPLLMLMIWSGLLIYWANPAYRVGAGGYTLFAFFPDGFFAALGVPFRLAEGMSLHFFFMWFFVINGLLFVAYAAIWGEWRDLLPNRHSFKEALQVTLYELRLSRVPLPARKFNGAQQLAYTAVILMAGLSCVTGVAIYKPVQFAWLATLLGGYEWARWEHFVLAVGYVLFLAVHLLEVASAGWSNFRGMVTGYRLVDVAAADLAAGQPTDLPDGAVS